MFYIDLCHISLKKMKNQMTIFFLVLASCFQCYHSSSEHVDPSERYSYVSDGCDWQGSKTLTPDADRSVVPIYLRCSHGTIKWFYPTGGLRVVLKFGTDNKDFAGCIRIARNTSRNVRIYIEGKRQLFQIFSYDDGKNPDLFRCFVSVNHFIALFIETDLNSLYPHDAVIFKYDLRPLKVPSVDGDYFNSVEDCSPCSDHKILKSFCSADLSLIGRIAYYREAHELDLTEFIVQPYYIYRLLMNETFVSDLDLIHQSPKFPDSENFINQESISQIILNRPLQCVPNITMEKYLFLGKRILDKYFITCTTKLIRWKRISQRAIAEETNQCHLG